LPGEVKSPTGFHGNKGEKRGPGAEKRYQDPVGGWEYLVTGDTLCLKKGLIGGPITANSKKRKNRQSRHSRGKTIRWLWESLHGSCGREVNFHGGEERESGEKSQGRTTSPRGKKSARKSRFESQPVG